MEVLIIIGGPQMTANAFSGLHFNASTVVATNPVNFPNVRVELRLLRILVVQREPARLLDVDGPPDIDRPSCSSASISDLYERSREAACAVDQI